MERKKILITDDDADERRLIKLLLNEFNFEIIEAVDGEEGVSAAQSSHPDLIIMDHRMPKMTGYEACIAMKQNPAVRDIPVIFLSAKGQESEVQSGMDAGALDYILKPFAPEILLQRLKEILEKINTK